MICVISIGGSDTSLERVGENKAAIEEYAMEISSSILIDESAPKAVVISERFSLYAVDNGKYYVYNRVCGSKQFEIRQDENSAFVTDQRCDEKTSLQSINSIIQGLWSELLELEAR
uniref:AlNc14C73G4992 protein n=1 Tax=Albugo laibachii Nc14 TaxID=890382 RepID=F0WED5_9STRA|nr:AlNc14C73G4992 [Albugo laibachii Nc14]|eukprot:CCA19567.1 AlNc14C73G4992 [Albugo laibachii Nc14]